MKKLLISIFAGIMVLSLTACGGEKEIQASKEHIYKAEEVALNEIDSESSIYYTYLQGERLYVIASRWVENGREDYVISKNTDGSDTVQVMIPLGTNQYMSNYAVDEQGNLYAILDEYFEDASDPENYIWEDNYYLVKLDSQGKEIWRQSLKEEGSESYYGVNWMRLLKDGRIVIMDMEGMALYDAEGKLQKKIKRQEDSDISDIIQLADGTLVVNTYNPEINKYVLKQLTIETGELSGEYIIPGNSSSYSCYPGIGYDLLLVNNSGVSGYNLGDENVTELMNFIDSDLNSSYIYNIIALNDKEFYGLTNEDYSGRTLLMKFTKVDPKDVVDKKILTLGCNGLGWDIRNQVVAFNKTNDKYRIQIRDYTQYVTDDDYMAGLTKLNTDIASGNVPDILILDNYLPVGSYISKGLFEDLYPYIDKDEQLDRTNYFSNILKAYEVDGKLYQLIPSFTVLTVAVKTSDVGNAAGWTLEELNAIMASKPKGTEVFTQETRGSILNYSIQMSGDQFIDWETGECRFNTDAFISLLEFLKQFPEQYEDVSYDDAFWRSYDSLWREGKVLLKTSYLDSFSSYNYMKKGTFGEDITLIGFPSENRNGSSLMPNLDIVMSSKSKNKDGAWQFIRYFLTDEYQETITYGWPLSLKRTDELAEKAKQKESYEDENGEIVEYDPTYYIGGVEIPIEPMTQEEVDEVLKFIGTLGQAYTYDENLINIISEEAAPYFSGQKNAKEVSEIIQSRVQIYVNENR